MADIDVVNSKIQSLTTEAQSLRTKIKSIASKYDVLITDEDTPETMLDKIVDEVEPKKTMQTGFKYKKCYALEVLTNNVYYINAETLGVVGVENTYTQLTFRKYAFSDNTNLRAVNLNNLPVSGFNLGQYCFANCTNLENFDASDGNLVQINNYAFDSCTKLKNVKINCNYINDYAFNGCSAITSLTITNTTPPSLQSNAFTNSTLAGGTATIYVPASAVATYQAASGWSTYASQIAPYYVPTPEEYLNISNGVCSGFTTAGQTAYNNGEITELVLPNTVTSLANNAFDTKLLGMPVTLVLPTTITSISFRSFYGCTGLQKVVIPTSVTTIANNAFQGCTSLTKITIPDSVTSIGQQSFQGCTVLSTIEIGSGITTISNNAFYNCTGLSSFTITATTPPTLGNAAALDNTNNCPIYVPSANVTSYQTANNWSNFASRIQAIQP